MNDETTEQDFSGPPLITVVIPCYNHGKYLKEAVESITSQTYKNLEIIVVDDGSSDNTSMVMSTLPLMDKRIRLLSFEENMGKWFCLNEAIKVSNGALITCQDADDLALPDRIERQFAAIANTNSIHCLCGFHHCFTEADIEDNRRVRVGGDLQVVPADVVAQSVTKGFDTPGINHYFTGEFETAGTSAMFIKALWNVGFRFNPPN